MLADVRSIQRALEEERAAPEEALGALARLAYEAPTSALRVDACRVLGALSGRALRASWDVAERAAFVLLDAAREADALAERVGLLHAMGRGFHNMWLMPYVQRRLSDEDEAVAAAAISAAGGLAFPALEEALASAFLGEGKSSTLRLAAIGALGRMGAESAAPRLVPFVTRDVASATAALSALTEIRSRVGEEAALAVLAGEPPRELLIAAVRYLAEVGREEVLRTLRRMARDEDAELRIAAGLASRAFKAERSMDAAERILVALTEQDRAVRAALSRRLRTLPVPDVLAQAELLLRDDPAGVVAVVAEVRAPEVTRLLLRVAADEGFDVVVRARAAGAIEADEAWERDALVGLVTSAATPVPVRVAAARTLGAFATPAYVLDHLAPLAGDAAPELRAALLWALQLASRIGHDGGSSAAPGPGQLSASERARAEAVLRAALADADPAVRRRAAYVAGNLESASLVPELLALARAERERADLRVAAFVALGEIGSPARFADYVDLWNREDDPQALGAVSRAIERAVTLVTAPLPAPAPAPDFRKSGGGGGTGAGAGGGGGTGSKPADASPPSAVPVSAPPSLARAHDRLPKLLGARDAAVRAAAARVAGLVPWSADGAAGGAPLDLLAALSEDEASRVREQAVTALGRIGAAEAVPALVRALGDVDAAVQERAADALARRRRVASTIPVLDLVSRAHNDFARRVAARLALPDDAGAEPGVFTSALRAALRRAGQDHPAYETLLVLEVEALEASRPAPRDAPSVDAAIAERFPAWPRLSAVHGFAPLAKSLRTAELLSATNAAGGDADLSASIVLWMKCLEGYLHAVLAPRLGALQHQPSSLWELTDRMLGAAWSPYQRWLGERWADPVAVGALSVEVPLRSVVNALRDLQERRYRPLDAPMSVTEWSRIMLFLALDHPSGPRNLLKLACRDPDRTVRLAHRLHVLALVRNVVTHRSVADAATLAEFRRAYYAAFEELVTMA